MLLAANPFRAREQGMAEIKAQWLTATNFKHSVIEITPVVVEVLFMHTTCPGVVVKYSGKLLAATNAPPVGAVIVAAELSVTEK